MENVLLGTDIMPSAAHLTASMLSSAHPQIGYDESLVRVLPYGIDKGLSELRQGDEDTPYIGALDLRTGELGHSLFTKEGMGHLVEIGGKRMTGKAKRAESGRDFPVEHESFDLVIMNPPVHETDGTRGGKSRRTSSFVRGIRHLQGRAAGDVPETQSPEQTVRSRRRGIGV